MVSDPEAASLVPAQTCGVFLESRPFVERRPRPQVSRDQQPNTAKCGFSCEPAPSCAQNLRGFGTMGLFTKDIKTMNDLFVHQLQDISYAEQQLTKALP